jgi:deoxyribose-phosphate aldolase
VQSKVFEAKLAIDHGANEIDMVINIGRLKDYQDDYILNEIKKVKEVCKNHILKVIIETALLTQEEKKRVTDIVANSTADFIKTSTGFSYHGATIEDIQLIKSKVNGKLKIKAAGGVKNLTDFLNMISNGADRIGTSNGVAIIKEIKE